MSYTIHCTVRFDKTHRVIKWDSVKAGRSNILVNTFHLSFAFQESIGIAHQSFSLSLCSFLVRSDIEMYNKM